MVKIGIVIDDFHFKHKVTKFLEYLNTKAEISYYLEESTLLKKSISDKLDENIFFVKGRGALMIELVKNIEKNTDIPIINSSKGIWLSIHRFLHSIELRKAGVIVPDFSLNPMDSEPPFEDFIIKNIVDQKNYAFIPTIERRDGKIQVADKRALTEAVEKKEEYHYYYYQKFIKSKWEYKIYGVGETLYFYKQLPVLINPIKMESRCKIEEIPELREAAYKAMKAIDLKLTSMDFLKSKDGIYYLTDINCTPNFNYIKDGHKIVADFLIKAAKT